ncbi:hypothetical protein [Phreatobacter sp.]|uniref:hypothetical protein n=1 Tax=Phreatobacter sp. TaxID=1966341 RepID=UPI003F7139B2
MGVERDLFSTAAAADQAELKAHAALYAAQEASVAPVAAAEPVLVTARARPVPQGGAALAQRMREKLVAERAQLVAVSRRARPGSDNGPPGAAILRFSLSDLPRLTAPRRNDTVAARPEPDDRPGKDPAGRGAR